jgi:hypothetical protein
MRLQLAPTTALTVARGHNKKAHRSSLAAERQAMVSPSDKATGESADNTRAGLTPTYPGKRTQLKLATTLSSRLPSRSRHGADDEHSSF